MRVELGVIVLIKEALESYVMPSAMLGYSKKTDIYELEVGPLQTINLSGS